MFSCVLTVLQHEWGRHVSTWCLRMTNRRINHSCKRHSILLLMWYLQIECAHKNSALFVDENSAVSRKHIYKLCILCIIWYDISFIRYVLIAKLYIGTVRRVVCIIELFDDRLANIGSSIIISGFWLGMTDSLYRHMNHRLTVVRYLFYLIISYWTLS